MAVPLYVEGHDGTGRARVRVGAARLFDVPVPAPLMTDAKPATKVATAAINLVIGIAVGSLVAGAARSVIRPGRQNLRLPEH